MTRKSLVPRPCLAAELRGSRAPCQRPQRRDTLAQSSIVSDRFLFMAAGNRHMYHAYHDDDRLFLASGSGSRHFFSSSHRPLELRAKQLCVPLIAPAVQHRRNAAHLTAQGKLRKMTTFPPREFIRSIVTLTRGAQMTTDKYASLRIIRC